MEYVFTALIPIVAVAIIVYLAVRTASHPFQCKHCSGEFRIKWSTVLVARHVANDYMLTCPHCHTRDWCAEQLKNESADSNGNR